MGKDESGIRDKLSKWIVFPIIGISLGISIFEIIYCTIKGNGINLTITQQTLIPLWSTWTGAVLAFYYGKANFKEATQTYKEVLDRLSPNEKLASVSVISIMIPKDKIISFKYNESINKKLETILKENVNRFVFVDECGILQYVVHRSEFTRFMTETALSANGEEKVKELTLSDFEKKSKFIKLENTAKFVAMNATLLEANIKMKADTNCEDVFITNTGDKKEPICGMITNVMILEQMNS